MKSLKSAARRGGAISAAALSALALAACSAGQVSQTADKVAAVDGNAAGNKSTGVSVSDVTVLVNNVTGETALKFTASNQDPQHTEHKLQSVSVDGQKVTMNDTKPLGYNCSLVGDSQALLKSLPQDKNNAGCTEYVATSLQNKNYPFGGNLPVEFTFDNGTVKVDATVAAPILPAGQVPRDYTNGSTVAPEQGAEHK